MNPLATVLITTRNRKEELAVALRSILAQDTPVEILVIDDGSTDGTTDFVRREFPTVRVERSEKSLGLIAQRHRGAQLATAPILISMDDDAIFSTPHIVAQTLADFDHPRVGAVAIPFIDIKHSPNLHQAAPSKDGVFIIAEYRGTAHALRRELFLKLGGYHGFLFRQGEEGDFCIHLTDAGYCVRLGRSDPIHHMESPRRSYALNYRYQARNNLLRIWYNVPLPYMPLHLAASTFTNLRSGLQCRYFWATAFGLLLGCGAILQQLTKRAPVSRQGYRLYRKLLKSKPLTLDMIEGELPPIAGNTVP